MDPVPAPPFSPGNTLTFNVSGADVPALTATVTAPTALVGFTTPTTISRATGYNATWTQDTGRVWIVMDALGPSDEVLLLCKVPDTGAYMVTPAALALLPSSVTGVTVAVARADEEDVIRHATDGGQDSEFDFVALDSVIGSGQTTLTP
jgi:hypothetical protein